MRRDKERKLPLAERGNDGSVGLSPRACGRNGHRRGATAAPEYHQLDRRSATRRDGISHRELKPAATVAGSLRDQTRLARRSAVCA